MPKFNRHSDETMCAKPILDPAWEEGQAEDIKFMGCARTSEHKGDCIGALREAGEADGVRWCCRVKLDSDHTAWCPIARPHA